MDRENERRPKSTAPPRHRARQMRQIQAGSDQPDPLQPEPHPGAVRQRQESGETIRHESGETIRQPSGETVGMMRQNSGQNTVQQYGGLRQQSVDSSSGFRHQSSDTTGGFRHQSSDTMGMLMELQSSDSTGGLREMQAAENTPGGARLMHRHSGLRQMRRVDNPIPMRPIFTDHHQIQQSANQPYPGQQLQGQQAEAIYHAQSQQPEQSRRLGRSSQPPSEVAQPHQLELEGSTEDDTFTTPPGGDTRVGSPVGLCSPTKPVQSTQASSILHLMKKYMSDQ